MNIPNPFHIMTTRLLHFVSASVPFSKTHGILPSVLGLFLLLTVASSAHAGGTSHWVATSEADFKAGTLHNVVATNLGDLKLSRAVRMLLTTDPKVSAVYCMVEGPDKTIYAGTGPEGVLLQIKEGKISTALTLESGTSILSLAMGKNGELFIGTGGEAGRVLVVTRPGDAPREIFTADGVQYIWALRHTPDGNLYAATGPNGQLFAILPGEKSELIYDSDENNLLSLATDGDDTIFAGSDPHGLIYKINRKTKEVFVAYDAAEAEVSALLVDAGGNVYAATAESDGSVAPTESAAATDQHGRPESSAVQVPIPNPAPPGDNPAPPALPDPNPGEPPPVPSSRLDNKNKSGSRTTEALEAIVWLVSDEAEDGPAAPAVGTPESASTTAPAPTLPPGPGTGAQQPRAAGNAVYKIDKAGFVSEIFRQPVMALCLLESNGSLLIGTGSDGVVYQVNAATEETVVVAKVESKQVMSLFAASDGQTYLGLANAGGIASMSPGLATEGTYISAVLDATQISRFGKMQLQGSIPDGSGMLISTRSGNVADASQVGWSDWSKATPAARFLAVASPLARYLQYQLTLTSKDGSVTPAVEVVDIAYQVPNLPPVVTAIVVTDVPAESIANQPAVAAPSKLTISWEASDPNSDALQYALAYRSDDRAAWILIREKLAEPTYEFDTRSLPDGRYVLRVQASDGAANEAGTGRTASRVSDPIFIDNTAPVLANIKHVIDNRTVTVKARILDRTTTVSSVTFDVDATGDWQLAGTSDKIFDSSDEEVSFVVPDLTPGDHQITVRAADSRGNVTFENILVTIHADAAKK